jgi:hypothetical protein
MLSVEIIVVLVKVLTIGLLLACMLRFLVQRLTARELAIQRLRALESAAGKASTRATPAELLESMSHNLTAVHLSDVCSGATCAICLGELANAVERTAVKEHEVAPPPPTPPPTKAAPPATPEPAAVSVKIGAEHVADAGHVIISVQLDCADAASDARNLASAAVTDGPALQSLMCGHCFHGECIRGWIVHRGAGVSCPLCKLELGVRSSPATPEVPADQA